MSNLQKNIANFFKETPRPTQVQIKELLESEAPNLKLSRVKNGFAIECKIKGIINLKSCRKLQEVSEEYILNAIKLSTPSMEEILKTKEDLKGFIAEEESKIKNFLKNPEHYTEFEITRAVKWLKEFSENLSEAEKMIERMKN